MTATTRILTPRGAVAAAAMRSIPRLPRDPFQVCLFFLTILNISRIHQAIPQLGALRPSLLLGGGALAAAFLLPGSVAKGWTNRWTTKVVAGITCATLGSIVFGISQGGAFFVFSQSFSKVLVGAFLLMAAIRNARDLWFFAWAYVIGCGVLVWMALFTFSLNTSASGTSRLSGLYMWDANDLGLLLLIGLALCLLVLRTSGLWGRVFAGVVIVGIGAAIARSGSRGAFVGLGCFLLVYLFSVEKTSVARRLGFISVLAAGLIVAAPQGYWEQMGTLRSVQDDYNWNARQGRKELALRGMGYMLSRPLFGIGVGNFGRAEGTISSFAVSQRAGDAGPGIKWSVAHNSYVDVGAELGIPGFILFTGLVLGCIVSSWRLRRRIPPEWASGAWEQRFLYQTAIYLPLAGVGFAVPAVFLSFAYLDPIYILAAMTGGLSASVHARLKQEGRSTRALVVPGHRHVAGYLKTARVLGGSQPG